MLNFGGFLSSNFWTNYRCQSSASIEDLLNNKDCTVDKLLDDDDCLQEFKNFNDKLIKYFDHEKLTVLIDYITVMPTKEDGHNRGHKYPFIAGEIFNCEINQILDKFFEAPIKVKPAPEENNADDEEEKDEVEAETEATNEEAENSSDKDTTAEKQEGAKNLEEVTADANAEKSTEATTTDEGATTETAETTEATSKENPQTEETKAETEEVKEEAKTEETVTDASAEKDKNTQEPEAEQNDKKDSAAAATTDEQKKSEPEEEETEAKAEDLSTKETTATVQTTEADEEEEEPVNKYHLLDRLFKFIRTEGDISELNPVLSGYFCKLVSLLISRKQKQLVPYVFDKDSDVIDCLLKHVEQKSISEILNKLLTQIDTDYEPELMAQIQEKQQKAVSVLISKLGPELHEENNLNGSAIIRDMCEIKEFYNLVCKKENIQQIVDYSLAPMGASTKASKTSSLTVLNQIIYLHIEKQKKKDQNRGDGTKLDNGNEEEDDMIVQQNSDDETNEDLEASNPNSIVAQGNVLVEVLKEKIGDIAVILQADHQGDKIQNSVTDEQFVPLGQQRLRTVELVHKMVQLRKDALYDSLGASLIFKNIIDLVKQYPWNNFLQLKVMNIFNDVLDNCENVNFKKDFLTSSGIGPALVEMSETASFTMESERNIRNGYMALVVHISNKLQKKVDQTATDKTPDITVSDYLESVGEDWRAFVDNELKRSNENNNKTLGGSTTRNIEDDDEKMEENNYDVQMEKIMQRFTNFNRILSQNSATDEEDDDEDEDTQEEEKNFDEDDGDKSTSTYSDTSSDAGVKI